MRCNACLDCRLQAVCYVGISHTCGSHVAVVFIFYGYVTPRKRECVLRLKQKQLTLRVVL